MTEEEKKEIAGRVAGILATKFKKEILDEVKSFLPEVIDSVKKRVREEVEPRVAGIMLNLENFIKERNILKAMEDEARWIMLRALRDRAEDWARKCVKGVKFSFDDIFED